MPFTVLTPVTPFGPYGAVVANALDIAFTAADATNGNSFPLTGGEILLVWNTDASAHTFSITSVADTLGRTGDVTTYSVGAGIISAYSFRGGVNGWQQGDGTVHIPAASSALLKFCVLKPKS